MRRATLLERAWARGAREALGPEGRVVPQQPLANTSAPGVSAQDRRRLDLDLYGATRVGEALCCDATLVAPLRRDGRPQPRAANEDDAAIAGATKRRGTRSFAGLAGGRWGPEACSLVDRLVRLLPLRG